MELRQLRYFIVLAEELHFGNAAKRIHIAQSALSQQIKNLEDELSTALFFRDTHSVVLTDAGGIFLDGAKKILEQVRQTETAVAQAKSGYYGILSIGFVEAALGDIFPEIIKRFHSKYPHVEIVPHHMNTMQQIEALRHGEIQAGFVGTTFKLPGILFHAIRQDDCVLALPPWHPLASEEKIALADVSMEKFVAIRRECGPFYYDCMIQNCMDHGFSPQIILTADAMQPLLAFVASGIGIALIHESAKHIRKDLCYVPIAGIIRSHYEISLAWNDNIRSQILYNFIDEVKAFTKTSG